MIPPHRRNQHAEPEWCDVQDHNAGGQLRHRSAPVEVGRRQTSGVVTAWLVQPVTGGDPGVLVNACQAIGITVPISLDDAERFCAQLQALLRQAGR